MAGFKDKVKDTYGKVSDKAKGPYKPANISGPAALSGEAPTTAEADDA